jgi:hypothetical protein
MDETPPPFAAMAPTIILPSPEELNAKNFRSPMSRAGLFFRLSRQ